MKLPFYEKPNHPVFPIGKNVKLHMMEIVDFLRWVINRDKLEIVNYFEQMDQDPFFLVAATGLGKTVGVPVHVLLRQIQRAGSSPQPEPRVWVVEPRIPIAIDQSKFMNSLWDTYRKEKKKPRTMPLFGCISSTSGKVNPEAPIQFVTTGIFEMLATSGELDPNRDRVIIDEAHVTVEQNAGVELGIALARQAGVTVDYMSATVDTSTLSDALGVGTIIRADKQRFRIWKSNLLESLNKRIVELVGSTLISPNLSSGLYPDDSYPHAKETIAAVLEPNRSHGMLVVVNSFAGEHSDANQLAEMVREAYPQLAVLLLASEVIRNAARYDDFQRTLKGIEARKEPYVIVATSVVEMGITFPTLDYIVTMDSGYNQETIGNVTFPVVTPLGVNSLLQRIGRVGRRRPGIAYISREVGAPYADLEPEVLNSPQALRYETIKFPLSNAPLMPLAYHACKHGWQDTDAELRRLNLPSRLHENTDRMTYLHEQIETLEQLGISEDNHLTNFGKNMEQWVGRADLAYAVALQRSLEEGFNPSEMIFWVIATALSNTPISTLRAKFGYFIDHDGAHAEAPHELKVWPTGTHEDIVLFETLLSVARFFPTLLWSEGNVVSLIDETQSFQLHSWCNRADIDGRKLLQAAKAIRETWRLFGRINGDTPQYQSLFGDPRAFKASTVPWQSLAAGLAPDELPRKLSQLVGTTTVLLTYNEDLTAFEWVDEQHGHEGIIRQDDTPLRLTDGQRLTARVIPSKQEVGGATTWRVAHIGLP